MEKVSGHHSHRGMCACPCCLSIRPSTPFLAPVNKRFSLERKFGWLAFPGLIRSIASLQLVFFVLLLFRPEAAEVFIPFAPKIKEGEIWRLVSFVFYPLVNPHSGFGPVFSCFFAFIAMRISFLINDVLEDFWGELRTSLFVYAVIISQSLIYFFDPIAFAVAGGSHYYLSIFFAFATLQPQFVFRLFFILPVPVWLIAALAGLSLVGNCIKMPIFAASFLGPQIIYLTWATPRLIRWMRNRGKLRVRRAKFESGRPSGEQTLHRCAECGKTELSDPELDFRVSSDGEEYCLDHLRKSDKGSAP